MSDGRYIFRQCVPDGSIDIANVQPGEVINRQWSWRVNMPLDLQEQVDNGELDPRNIMRGYDGELYDGDGNFLAEVNTWHAQINVTNSDYNPAGEKITWSIPMSYTITLTFTETVIKDATLLAKINNGLKKGQPDAVLNFTGVLRGRAS
ncbi:endoglucanase [Bacillus sp. FJAT-45350]|uniref:endoglucanase n=1 Tax=Bacillus sp. FJAT-45350 TaxID=2011014 RepID=UPI000BB98112|nr:endoglucanase [Bacillus sp. FJAT-45350]